MYHASTQEFWGGRIGAPKIVQLYKYNDTAYFQRAILGDLCSQILNMRCGSKNKIVAALTWYQQRVRRQAPTTSSGEDHLCVVWLVGIASLTCTTLLCTVESYVPAGTPYICDTDLLITSPCRPSPTVHRKPAHFRRHFQYYSRDKLGMYAGN